MKTIFTQAVTHYHFRFYAVAAFTHKTAVLFSGRCRPAETADKYRDIPCKNIFLMLF